MKIIFARLAALFFRRRRDADMVEEMRLHLEQRAEEHVAAGMPPEEARYAALRKFGGVEQAKELARSQRAGVWLEQVVQDAAYAVRALRKNPGFASVVVLTLALGIGANTTVFTVANALLLRGIPVAEPERLVQFRSRNGDESFSYPTFGRFRDQARTVDGITLVQRTPDKRMLVATGLGARESETVSTQAVTGSFFSVLGVRAALGRVFTEEEDKLDAPQPVAVLSHGYWQRRFGADPGVLGKTIDLDGVMLTIVGVLPREFTGFVISARPDIWWPMSLVPQFERNPQTPNRLKAEGWEWALIVARLREGVSFAEAEAELRTLFLQERTALVAKSTTWSEPERRQFLARTLTLASAGHGYSPLRERLRQPLTMLGAIVGLVLLIACANIAGLLLARGAARRRELTVRAALGASRGRLVRQLATEGVVLALLGGAVGLGVAHAGTRVLLSYLEGQPGTLDLGLDGRVLGATMLLSLGTGLLFGLLPAWRLSANLNARAQGGEGRSRLNQVLVALQIGLSVALLAGAGLFVRSLQNLKAADLGFQPERVVRFSLGFGRSYDARQRAAVYTRVLGALAARPEVRSATLAGAGLMSGENFGIRIAVDGYTPKPDEDVRAAVTVVGPRFFETLGIPLRAGRDLPPAEIAAVPASGAPFPRVAVVGEAFVRRFFGDANPIGRTIKFGLNAQQPLLEIVGVAKDVKYRNVRETAPMAIYVPYFGGVMNVPMAGLAATDGDLRALQAALRPLVREIDPAVVVGEIRPLEDVVDDTLLPERIVAHFAGFFGLFALTLAGLGLYGVLSYGVAQRTREIGVRMALGARAGDVVRMVVGQGVKLALAGTLLGLAAALGTTHLATKLLYGVQADDPVTFAGVAVVLLGVAACAAWLPARRAARVDPMIALRAE